MRGFGIIMGFDGLGWLLHTYAGIPLPSHVLGLLLLVAALFTRVIKLEWVEESATFLTKHMMLFFIPLLAGVTAFAKMLGDSWLAAVVSLTAGTLVILLSTGIATQFIIAYRRKEVADVEQQSDC
ncbi:CidA/LrgA family protein [Paenibacillus sp. OV219]|uniref:CidA/LrgA family protein n=1 Tax=Paenibacillus sp. OV219 TaxID=1884377 RepID=UPI0008BA7287|nr:CidA/LrgA family protein [Paenibacillus sp. OV219]SEN29289.1 holin-like protein [Paenibacillus sp. OV219]